VIWQKPSLISRERRLRRAKLWRSTENGLIRTGEIAVKAGLSEARTNCTQRQSARRPHNAYDLSASYDRHALDPVMKEQSRDFADAGGLGDGNRRGCHQIACPPFVQPDVISEQLSQPISVGQHSEPP
jgi:hypothetical protein